MALEKRTMRKIAVLIGGGILFYWLLQNSSGVISVFQKIGGYIFPFFLGFIIAFLLNIPMKFVEQKIFRNKNFKGRRICSYLITLIFVFGAIIFVGFTVAPQLVDTVATLINKMPSYISRLEENLAPYEQYIPQLESIINELKLDWSAIGEKLFSALQNGAGNAFSYVLGFAGSLISGVSSIVIGFIFSAYLLLDKEHLCAQFNALLKAYLPERTYNKLSDIANLTSTTFSKFVSGQCIEMVAIGTVFTIVLWVGKFDYALLIGVLIGFFSLIPVFGAFIACAIGAFLILVSSGLWRAVAFIIVFIVVQQLDGNFMYPKIVGNSIGLPPVWVLVAVTIGGGLMGVAGMLFFIPLTSVMYTLLRRHAVKRLQKKGINYEFNAGKKEEINKRKKPKK